MRVRNTNSQAPPDGEEHHQVADETLESMGFGDGVVQAVRGLGDRHDENEIE